MTLIRVALSYLLEAISLIILVRCILSWLPLGYNRFSEFIYNITEPILAPIRNLLSRVMSGQSMFIDFSPVVAFLLISVLQRLVWII